LSQARLANADPAVRGGRGEAFEEKVALVWFARIGAFVLLCGVGYFYSYAVERDWISPLARCLLGAVIGGGLIVGADLLRRKTHPLYVQVLFGLGLAFFYLSDYAAFGFYSLITAAAALRLAAAISVFGGLLATRHRSQAIFVFSLVGAFVAPVLLSTGEDRPLALFAYLLVLTGLSFVIGLRQRFLYAVWVAVAGVPILFFGWYFRFFTATGAYPSLPSRWAPLTAVAAFVLLWLWVYDRARSVFGPPAAIALLLVALLFGHAGSSALLFNIAPAALLASIALAVVAAVALARERREELLSIPLVAGSIGLELALSLHANDQRAADILLPLVLTLAWAGIYFGASARAVLAVRTAETQLRTAETQLHLLIAAASLAALAAAALVGTATQPQDGLVRAALLAAIGIADGALGLAARRGAAGRTGNVLVAQSLALVALAASFALHGAALTLSWALLSAVVLCIAARHAEGDWLIFGLALWAIALTRCMLRAAQPGAEATLELAGCAAGLFVCWASARRTAAAAFPFWTPWLLTAGHLLSLWAILDRLAEWLPSLPNTLILAVYATLLVAGGFVFRERHHRYLGLVLFAITIAKLVLWDVFHREVLFRVLVLIGVGVLLLGASFLYARYGRRLLTLVRDGELSRPD
jgi:uncharacterized membrane protein